MTLASAAQLTLTPASAGDYLVFLLTNSTEAPGTSDCDTEWLDPSGVLWAESQKNPRGARQSQLLIRRTTLGPDPATIVLNASTRETAEVQYVRVAALRLDGLLAHGAGLILTAQSTTPASSQVANQLDPVVGPAPATARTRCSPSVACTS